MNFIELNDLPKLDLTSEFDKLLDDGTIHWAEHTDDQICLNTIPSKPDDIHFGRGSLTFDWDYASVDEAGKLVLPLREEKVAENDFTQLATPFKGTMFEEVYNALDKKYHLGRVRLMNSKPKTCLSWHTDATLRVHYPLKTQNGCFMVINDEVKILEKHKWYWTNTHNYHTAVNSSKDTRLHLVAVIIEEK